MTAYELIQWWYGDKTMERSKVKLINHIDEGLKILTYLNADQYVKDAYCLHPIIQSDVDFNSNLHVLLKMHPIAVALAVEYRHAANAWLSDKVVMGPYFPAWRDEPRRSVVPEVNMMLIADKVQNYKDFWSYHKDRHERSAELEAYFERWFKVLDISTDMYDLLVLVMNNVPVPPMWDDVANPEPSITKTEDGTIVTG